MPSKRSLLLAVVVHACLSGASAGASTATGRLAVSLSVTVTGGAASAGARGLPTMDGALSVRRDATAPYSVGLNPGFDAAALVGHGSRQDAAYAAASTKALTPTLYGHAAGSARGAQIVAIVVNHRRLALTGDTG